jgi:membrane protein YdbS with pleckstrin-like domain
MNENNLSMRRRLRFTTLILITQMLLIALAVTWLLHMITIAVYGSVYFVENNPLILWAEIAASLLITIFAIFILALQIQRLGERRRSDRNGGGRH